MQILCNIHQQRNSCVTDAPFGLIDNSSEPHYIVGVFHNAHVSGDIPDFLPVVEPCAAVDAVWNTRANQGALHHIGLCIHAVENSIVVVCAAVLDVL